MPNKQCWMLNDECSHSHTLTLSHSHSLDSWFIYERWVRKDECRMINAGCWVPSPTLTLSHSHTQKKSCWAVPNPNRELFIVTSKKTRLNRCPSQQRTLHCDIEKGKTEPFSIRTGNTAIVISKKRRLNRTRSQQRTQHCCIKKEKTKPFPLLTWKCASL